jgi:hypothetical protein
MYSRPRRPEEPRDERRPARTPEPGPEQRLLALQRSAGNAAVARMLTAAPHRMIARDTEIVWGSDDHKRLMHIMPWKHGWDELFDVELPMVDEETGTLRPEDASKLSEGEKKSLVADYEKAKALMTEVLKAKAGRTKVGGDATTGERWEFKMEFPKERTRRKVKALTIVIKGFRPSVDGVLQDKYIIGDAWVETDRQEYLKKHGWNATGYVAPQPVGVGEGGQ